MPLRCVALAATASAAFLVLAPPALAAGVTYVVNGTADTPDADVGTAACRDAHGKCTLRAAIMQANFHPGADTIRLPAGTFRLTRPGADDAAVLGDLDITDDVTLRGRGSAATIVDGNGAVTLDRVFQVLATAKLTTFQGLTIRNGRRTATFDEGGGLYWDGGGSRLSLQDVILEGNRGYYGGGAYLNSNGSDTVVLDRVAIRKNTATAASGGLGVHLGDFTSFAMHRSNVSANTAYEGGGVYMDGSSSFPGASVGIDGTVIAGNHASLSAGVEYHSNIPLVMQNDEVLGNVATAYGGAIGNYGVLQVSNSTVAGNSAVKGGALYDYEGGNASLLNVTVSGNTAQTYGGGVYEEVFIHNLAVVTLTDDTFSRNTAGTAGGGVYRDPAGPPAMTITNSLFARGAPGANCSDAVGGANNLSDDASCGFGAGDGIANLRLSPLADHGGATPTILPMAGSPAVDGGAGVGVPATDQRGITRPQGSMDDVGAVEVCQARPKAPAAVGPKARIRGPRVTLDWKDVPCVEGYSVLLKLGSSRGRTVQKKAGLHSSAFRTRALARGTTYYWRVAAIGDRGATSSTWHRFKVR